MESFLAKSSMTILLLLLIASAFPIESRAGNPDWFVKMQQVKVGSTTRTEVEQLFRNPSVVRSIQGTYTLDVVYRLKVGQLIVYYSTGKCPGDPGKGYNVPADTAVGLTIRLSKSVRKDRLAVKWSDFSKYTSFDTNSVTYDNDANGIEFEGNDDSIWVVEFDIGENQTEFRCMQ